MHESVIDTHRFKGTFFFPANDGKKAGLWEQCFCGYQGDYPAHVEAELVRASTVTTEADLIALPIDTVVLDAANIPRTKRMGNSHMPAGWTHSGNSPLTCAELADGRPMRVLFRPV